MKKNRSKLLCLAVGACAGFVVGAIGAARIVFMMMQDDEHNFNPTDAVQSMTIDEVLPFGDTGLHVKGTNEQEQPIEILVRTSGGSRDEIVAGKKVYYSLVAPEGPYLAILLP